LKKALAANSNRNRNHDPDKGGGGNNNGANNDANTDNKTWPDWCDPDAYCWTCGYKLKKGHTSANCRFLENPGHKKEATRKKNMGGSQLNAGFGNAPNGK
jgi:hypothetical protein